MTVSKPIIFRYSCSFFLFLCQRSRSRATAGENSAPAPRLCVMPGLSLLHAIAASTILICAAVQYDTIVPEDEAAEVAQIDSVAQSALTLRNEQNSLLSSSSETQALDLIRNRLAWSRSSFDCDCDCDYYSSALLCQFTLTRYLVSYSQPKSGGIALGLRVREDHPGYVPAGTRAI